ncbi:MAG TPA: hypothetical protein VGA11_03530 [Acidimicrobiia bacterium]
MVVAIVAAILLGLVLAVIVAIARDHGPTPGDVAESYELAWDRLDFDVLYTLSAAELRDGRDRREFVESKRVAYENQPTLRDLLVTVAIDQVIVAGNAASVATRIVLRDGSTVRNRIDLVRRNSRWQVVAYHLTAGDNESPAVP